MIDMGIIVINSYAFGAASATAGITTSIVSDGDSDGDLLGASSNNFNDAVFAFVAGKPLNLAVILDQ